MARNKPNKPRVFCIGWHKTGTSTIGLALLELGYTVLGARLDMAEPLLDGDIETPLNEAGKYDALQDVPWAALYKELDQRYPGSKFILTTRKTDSWLHSASNHFKDNEIDLHRWLYGKGQLWGNEDLYTARYEKHYRDVREYFRGREDIIEMDFAAGDGWQKLCKFLDEPIPGKAFPHANKGKHSLSKFERLIQVITSIIPLRQKRLFVDYLIKKGFHKGRHKDMFNNKVNTHYNRSEKT